MLTLSENKNTAFLHHCHLTMPNAIVTQEGSNRKGSALIAQRSRVGAPFEERS